MLPKCSSSLSKPYSILLSLIVSVLLLTSCSVPSNISPTAIPPTIISASPTPLVPLSTPTPISGAAPTQAIVATLPSIPASPTPLISTQQTFLPTSTIVPLNAQLQPTLSALPFSGNIVFATGTTATVVQGTLPPGQVTTYSLQATQSQVLILIMDSPNKDVTLGIFEPNGNTLLDPANKYRSWQGILPSTESYKILVTGGATTENYALTVKAAQIVNFATGTSSITLPGTTMSGYPFDYSLNCGAGQTMTASLNVPSSTAYLDIFGGATSHMLLYDSAKQNTWTGALPETQPYVVEVVPNNFQVVGYSLTVSCTGAISETSQSAANLSGSGNIVIKPGSTAAVMHGTVGPGQVVSYTLQASANQPLVLNVGTVGTSTNDVYLGLIYPDGTSIFSPPSYKYLNWQGKLHVTGLYTIQLFGTATTENYELTVKLPRIIYFPSDTHTLTIKSATEQGFVVSYAFYGNFGQTLDASLNVTSDKAYLDIYGLETGSILRYTKKVSSASRLLKNTEMYIIEVIPRGGWIYSYTLTLTLH